MTVVQAAQVVRTLEPGSYVEVLATDPGTAKEIAAWCRSTGNELVDASSTTASLFRFVIRRS
jgi:tRNA 2-thiouridine synthesizing protein A